MTTEALPLVVGIPGPTLTPTECEIIERVHPTGVIFFSRNIESPEQVRQLVAALNELEAQPFISVDLEGGPVNRLKALWGDLPPPSAAAASGRRAVRALGEAAGAACRALGIHLDLAPVVDLDCPEGLIGAQRRCLSGDPERVATLARLFHDGLTTWGVAGCLKHFPGLGAIAVDTHEELPVLPIEDLDAHLEVFASLSRDVPMVMMGHAVAPGLGDPDRPASLSRSAVDQAADLPGSPVVLSDDLEMGALSGHGDLPQLVVKALRARNHGVLVCNAFDRLTEIADLIDDSVESHPTFKACISATTSRLGTLRRDLLATSAAVPAPDDQTVSQLWDQARRAADAG